MAIVRRAPLGVDLAEAERQQALMRHAVDQARGGDVIDERGVGDGKQGDAGEHDGRNEGCCAAHDLGDRAWRRGKLAHGTTETAVTAMAM